MAKRALRLSGQQFEIILGTNEEFILGYALKHEQNRRSWLHLTFTNRSHSAGLRAVVVCGKHLLSGGVDEAMHVIDLRRRTCIKAIAEHQGSITCLQQHDNKMVFSASEDGRVCIFKRGSWECCRSLVGHKGCVVAVAIHPSGKLALSVGQDRTLHTWDLVKGCKAFVCKTSAVASSVAWSPSGERYLVVCGNNVEVFLVQSGARTTTLTFTCRVNHITFVQDEVVAVGLESGEVALHDVVSSASKQLWKAHVGRVRVMTLLPPQRGEQAEPKYCYLVTASSDGWFKVWGLQMSDLTVAAQCITEEDTQCRITCMAVYSPSDEAKKTQELCSNENLPTQKPSVDGQIKQDASEDNQEQDQEEERESKMKRKKKKVQIAEISESEDNEDGEMEVIEGEEAMKLLGLLKSIKRKKLSKAKTDHKEMSNKADARLVKKKKTSIK